MKRTVVASLVVLLGTTSSAMADGEKRVGDPYPLATCAVAGAKLGSMGDPIVHLHEGREIKFCCAGCVGKFEAEPEKYLKAVDEQIIKLQRKTYPLKNCLMMPEEALENPDAFPPREFVINNRLVRVCCPGCERRAKRDPKGTIELLDKMVTTAQLASYPLDECIVSGNTFEGREPYDFVMGNRLYRVCCKGCVGPVLSDPVKYTKILNAKMVSTPGPTQSMPQGNAVEIRDVSARVPASWQAMELSSSMRVAHFKVPGEAGSPAELIAFDFGPQGAGSVEANIERWRSQFQKNGRPVPSPKVERFKSAGGLDVVLVVLEGDHKGMRATSWTPGQAAIRAIVEAPAGPLYVNLTGDAQVVQENRKAFEAMLRSMLGGA